MQSEHQFRDLFAAVPGRYLVLDSELRIRPASDAYVRATSCTREYLLDRRIFEVFPYCEDDADGAARLDASIRRALALGIAHSMPIQKRTLRRPEGDGVEVRYWSPINSPVRNRDGQATWVIHSVQDVTELLALRDAGTRADQAVQRTADLEAELLRRAQELIDSNEALRAANQIIVEQIEALAAASRAKSDFLAMMSHELRTPLNSIIGFSELLIDEKFGALNHRQARFLANVHESGRHLLGLIDDLLDLSKIEAGRFDTRTQLCSTQALAIEAIATLQPLADARAIRLDCADAEATPRLLVRGDPMRIKQVLYNLVSNAIKFTPAGGKVTITSAPTADGARLRTTVTDTGPGIAKEDHEDLFTPFRQLSRGKAIGGTGLGLALSKRLVQLMGGAIGLESELGCGARFFFELPLSERESSSGRH